MKALYEYMFWPKFQKKRTTLPRVTPPQSCTLRENTWHYPAGFFSKLVTDMFLKSSTIIDGGMTHIFCKKTFCWKATPWDLQVKMWKNGVLKKWFSALFTKILPKASKNFWCVWNSYRTYVIMQNFISCNLGKICEITRHLKFRGFQLYFESHVMCSIRDTNPSCYPPFDSPGGYGSIDMLFVQFWSSSKKLRPIYRFSMNKELPQISVCVICPNKNKEHQNFVCALGPPIWHV